MCDSLNPEFSGSPGSSADPGLEEELTRLLRQCGRFLFYQSACGQQQGRILHMLSDGALTQKQIQDRLGVKASSVSELVTKLESKSLVERRVCQSDRRVMEIHLTERGRMALPLSPLSPVQGLYSPLNESEKADLADMLQHLLNDWKEKALEKEKNEKESKEESSEERL